MEQFVSVCWGIWKNRNDLRMGGKGKAGRTVIRNALHLVEEFRWWSFTHTKRQGNVPAHLLAQHTKSVEDYDAWLEEVPPLIAHACLHDKM
ncbi:hypothetical protein CFP56_008785 [Quercus suber]|uniref:RNase H type-1 domain-containing protein n=1 Tax=Quercus suber TaxID=58331 RepID=A0AAW0L522_QUESU